EFELLQSGNQLKAVVRKAAVNERVKALSEGFVAALGLIARGSDLVEGQGLASATLAVARGASLQGVNWVPFAALSANRERLESGSHVDSSGFAVVAGIAKGFTVGSVRLAIGPFFEYGHGSYDTYNSFAASPAVHGDGRANYAGGGALARLELPHGPGALHFELSGRIGRLRNEYHSADLTSLTGIAASYDYSGTYYGYHFGAGYLWRASAKTSLDLSAKYFWTRQEGKEATLATGEKASFDAAESSRLRLGARLARDFSDKARVYVGAAWERELAGEARAYYWGLPVKAPSLKGDAGIGEVGVTLSPTDGGAFSLDFGVQGYVGQRRGATGSLRLQFEF
ncbi:MAG: autotransporter outer membrane beta-barrel domain-containing protein, partial [Deltaproteobacteria bacterium]|nr:autotransporter outer membrane beta-barrel domain-containing protein [Deltaproteobacteria bacterium]